MTELTPGAASAPEELAFSTLLGGTGEADGGIGIKVDSNSDIVVAGLTFSTDFPVTPNAFQFVNNTEAPGNDTSQAFLSVLNPSGQYLSDAVHVPGDADAHGHGHWERCPDSDRNQDGDGHGDGDGNRARRRRPQRTATATDFDCHGDPDRNGDCDRNPDRNGYRNVDFDRRYANPDGNGDCDRDPDGDCDRNIDLDRRYADRNCDPDGNGNCDCDPDGNGDSDSDHDTERGRHGHDSNRIRLTSVTRPRSVIPAKARR